MKNFRQRVWYLYLLPLVFCYSAWAQQTLSPSASPSLDELVSSYALMDAQTGQFLLERNSNERLPPASITKLMTAYLTFQALQSGKIHLEDKVSISQAAYKQEGSRMFVEINSQVAVGDLVQGMIVQSGNDASVALAEYIGGSVEQFVRMMNENAKKLGMNNSHFMNPTGMPDDNHYSSAHDLAILARAIVHQFPEYYHYYSQKEFLWNKIKQPNRNRLLWRNAQIDGLKTGHTEAAGYCLVASEKRGDTRMISVVLGAKKEEHRYEASLQLLNSGFALFSQVDVLKAGQVLQTVPVYKGKVDSVNLVPQQALTLSLPNDSKENIRLQIRLHQQMIAPLTKGEVVGVVDVVDDKRTYAQMPVVVGEAVEKAGFFKRFWHGIKLWWKQ